MIIDRYKILLHTFCVVFTKVEAECIVCFLLPAWDGVHLRLHFHFKELYWCTCVCTCADYRIMIFFLTNIFGMCYSEKKWYQYVNFEIEMCSLLIVLLVEFVWSVRGYTWSRRCRKIKSPISTNFLLLFSCSRYKWNILKKIRM